MSGPALRPPFRYAPLRPKGRQEREETLNLNCPVKGNHLKTPKATLLDFISAEKETPSYLDNLLEGDNSLWHYFKTKQFKQKKGKGDLLIFDQFEELFTYPDADILIFARELKELLINEIPDRYNNALEKEYSLKGINLSLQEANALYKPLSLKILLVIRSDRLGLLSRIKDQFPNILRYIYELQPFDINQARDAIIQPALLPENDHFFSPKFSYEERAIEKILDYLTKSRTQSVAPFQLQVLCQHFERDVIQKGKLYVEEGDFEIFKKLYQNYYLSQINLLEEDERLLARRLIEEGLILEEEEKRLSLYEGQILRDYKVTFKLLQKLVDSRLLRAELTTSGGYSYELSHDTLIFPVLLAKSKRLEEEHLAAEALEKERQEKKLQEERKKRLRFTWLAVLAFVIAAFALILGYYSFKQNKKIQKALRISENISLAYGTTDKSFAARVAEYAFENDSENPVVRQAYMKLTHDTSLIPYVRFLEGKVSGAAFSEESEKLLIADAGGNIHYLDFLTSELKTKYKKALPNDYFSKTVFSKDNSYCVSTDSRSNNEIYFFDLKSGLGKKIRPKYPGRFINSIAIDPIKDLILLTYQDAGTIVIDLDGNVLHSHKDETGMTLFTQFSSDGEYYLNVRMGWDQVDENLFVHDKEGRLLNRFRFENVHSASFSHDAKTLFVGFRNGKVNIYQLDSGEIIDGFETDQKGTFIFTSSRGNMLATYPPSRPHLVHTKDCYEL